MPVKIESPANHSQIKARQQIVTLSNPTSRNWDLPALEGSQISLPQGGKTVVICTAYDIGTRGVSDLTNWLTGLGHTVRIANAEIKHSILAGADALILFTWYGPVQGIEELNSTNAPDFFMPLVNWFSNGGGEFLWVSGDFDYLGRNWIA